MEGWLLTPATGFRPLPRTLPGLRQFLMVGQWVMPGAGLPSGLMTARAASEIRFGNTPRSMSSLLESDIQNRDLSKGTSAPQRWVRFFSGVDGQGCAGV